MVWCFHWRPPVSSSSWKEIEKQREDERHIREEFVCVCVCVWWVFLFWFGLGFCLCVCVHVWGFLIPLQSSACKWASFSYTCLFQALLLLHTGINLGADQAVKPTFIHSGLNCLAIISNLVPWHRRAPLSPCAPAARKPAAWHQEGFIQLEAMFNKHNGVKMAKVYW